MSYSSFAAKITNPDWETKLFDSNRLTPGQKEDLHKVIVWDFYHKNGGKASFAQFWEWTDSESLREFGSRYNLIKWELVTLGFYATMDVPVPSFKAWVPGHLN